jgi:DNA-binding response OmpR family regulator
MSRFHQRPVLLVVDDDRDLCRLVKRLLEPLGYEVHEASTAGRALAVAAHERPAAVLLDVHLPDMSGYEVCRRLRDDFGDDIAIVFLSGKRTEEFDRTAGMLLGADDYIVKPFRVGELIARARAFLRRRGPAPTMFRFGECEVDLRTRRVTRRGEEVELTAKEFAMLAYFCSRPGCALSRDVILGAVWGNAVFVTPRSIDRCIATLRAKIEDDPHRPVFIQTIRDIGYRFEPNGS